MSEWKTLQIGDIADVFDGPHATPKKTSSGPWFLSISSLSNGRLNLSESARLSYEDYVKWTRRVTPQEGDVLFSYETRLGEAALMPAGIQACLGRRMGLLRPKRDKVDPRFLLYAYIGPQFQEVIKQRSIHGATVDRIPLTELPTWPILIPSLSEQKAIAAVLGALDDKIAVNERIATTYERLFRLRFDQLRIDVEPTSTNAMPLADLVELNPVLPPPKTSDAVYVDMAALPTASARIREWSRREPKSGTRFQNGDTVMARITPCLENGKTAFIDFMSDGEIGIGSTEFIVLRAREGVPVHLPYFLARSARFRGYAIQNMVGSSGRQRVSAGALAQFTVARPDPRDLREFGESAAVAFAHMKSLDTESRYLKELRDTLLPGLMSGAIRVRDAEKVVEAAT